MSSKGEKGLDSISNKVLLEENRALKDQVQNLKARLEDAEELKSALKEGDLDALVFPGPEGNLIFTLDSADHAYRTLVKTMNKGTAILGFDGTILYCNHTFVIFLRMQPQKIVGTSIYRFITPENVIIFKALLENEMERGVIKLLVEGGISLPVCLSINSLWIKESPNAWCIVVTYMTKLKKANEILKLKLEELARSNEELNNLLHFIS
jgi:PAS domain-containing protein